MASDLSKKDDLPSLTERIVSTYRADDEQHEFARAINHLGHCPLPNYDVVLQVVDDLKEILYPGYRRRENLHLGNVTYYVGELIEGLHDKLTNQIARALRHQCRGATESSEDGLGVVAESPEGDFDALGQSLAISFLERLPALRETLGMDARAAFDGDPACTCIDEVIFCYPGLEAITVYRLAHELHRLGVPFIPRMMTEWAHKETGIDIHPGATIGPYFFIDHGTGVVVGETCEIGHHVKLYQGVTLGALSFPTDPQGNLIRNTKRHPTIQDHVVVYANATVLGGNTVVGRHSVVGSSVWLTRSVEPHSTVTIEPPKLVKRERRRVS